MPLFEAVMRVVHMETWTVEAANEDEARRAFNDLTEDVDTDETGGEVTDWEVYSPIKKVED